MNKLRFLAALLPMFLILASCSDDEGSGTTSAPPAPVIELPTNVTFESPSQYPEDFAYDAANLRFFAGSVFTGNIITVDWMGNVTDFASSDDLIATVGLLFDQANNQVVVLNGDPGFSDQGPSGSTGVLSTVIRYDANTGAEVARFDLSTLFAGGHFLNDVVLDNAGNLYITDSFSPAIYRITPGGETSVFATDPLFETAAGTFGLNGIAYSPDGFLLVTHYQNQILYKVSIADPTDITAVTINQAIGSADGIRINDGDLYVVSNSLAGAAHTAFRLNSTDAFATASVVSSASLGEGLIFPTTIEFAGGLPYVITSQLANLIQMPPVTNISTFEINQVEL